MELKRYEKSDPVCTCGRHRCICSNEMNKEVDGTYLNIEELVGDEWCDRDNGNSDCPFYSEMESHSGYDYHRCGMSGEWIRSHTKLDCPFKDIQRDLGLITK